MDAPNFFRVNGDGVEIQYAEWPGNGRAVVCVHGLTANCLCWGVIAKSIVAHAPCSGARSAGSRVFR